MLWKLNVFEVILIHLKAKFKNTFLAKDDDEDEKTDVPAEIEEPVAKSA